MGVIRFHSKSALEIVMLKPHAKQLFAVMGLQEPGERGVIQGTQLATALQHLRAAVQTEKAALADASPPTEDEEAERPRGMAEPVLLRQRAYPLMQMMSLAQQNGEDVHWGF
ncbi:MAG: DUF1840 domain-containing protein [Burkholderiaceae bacterium]|jgi:hypothetical protein